MATEKQKKKYLVNILGPSPINVMNRRLNFIASFKPKSQKVVELTEEQAAHLKLVLRGQGVIDEVTEEVQTTPPVTPPVEPENNTESADETVSEDVVEPPEGEAESVETPPAEEEGSEDVQEGGDVVEEVNEGSEEGSEEVVEEAPEEVEISKTAGMSAFDAIAYVKTLSKENAIKAIEGEERVTVIKATEELS